MCHRAERLSKLRRQPEQVGFHELAEPPHEVGRRVPLVQPDQHTRLGVLVLSNHIRRLCHCASLCHWKSRTNGEHHVDAIRDSSFVPVYLTHGGEPVR